MDGEENNQTSRKSLSLIESVRYGPKVNNDGLQSESVLENHNVSHDTSVFTTSVLSSEFQRDKKTQCDTFEDDEIRAIKNSVTVKPKSISIKSFESDDNSDSICISDGFDIEKQLALETKRSNPNSRTISKMKNIAFALVGCGLLIMAVVISINIYYRFNSIIGTEEVIISSFFSTITPKITTNLHFQGIHLYVYKQYLFITKVQVRPRE